MDSTYIVKKFSEFDDETRNRFEKCIQARENAYCPYSKFKVGAVVVTEDGTEYTGCNVENASYSMAICAERTAYVKAISCGYRYFRAVYVSASLDKRFVSPCGACRQFMSEFVGDNDPAVFLVKPERSEVLVTSVKKLLPISFSL